MGANSVLRFLLHAPASFRILLLAAAIALPATISQAALTIVISPTSSTQATLTATGDVDIAFMDQEGQGGIKRFNLLDSPVSGVSPTDTSHLVSDNSLELFDLNAVASSQLLESAITASNSPGQPVSSEVVELKFLNNPLNEDPSAALAMTGSATVELVSSMTWSPAGSSGAIHWGHGPEPTDPFQAKYYVGTWRIVPEPTSLALLGWLSGLLAWRRR